jgi:putative hydrolase of HD superfamily
MAMVLSEYAKGTLEEGDIDVCKVMKMALIHDIVEIDAGDVFIYDRKDSGEHYAKEQAAAKRIFGILPAGQAKEYISLWEEFEKRETPEAKFAAALDRLDPILHNYYTGGMAWREHGVTADRVLAINSRIGLASPELWDLVQALVRDCVAKGYLEPGNYSPVK